jgi:hypothetical protein
VDHLQNTSTLLLTNAIAYDVVAIVASAYREVFIESLHGYDHVLLAHD